MDEQDVGWKNAAGADEDFDSEVGQITAIQVTRDFIEIISSHRRS
jgi:hypothetical protein